MFVSKKHVTWEEIEEFEKWDEEMDIGSSGVFEEASIWGGEIDRILEEYIKYILEDEGLYDPNKMGNVEIPPIGGNFNIECPSDEFCTFEARFDVWDKTGYEILAQGVIYGEMIPLDKEGDRYKIMEVTVAMHPKQAKKLKMIVEGLANAARHAIHAIEGLFNWK